METPLFFSRGGERLFGVLHEPDRHSARMPFVFCHAFGEEKLWAHRVFVSFARHLAGAGHTVLRFDYLGNGDSEGEFESSCIDTIAHDICAAIEYVRKRTDASTVGLLGLRLGATLAALVAETRLDVSTLVLWAPIVDGSRYIKDLLRMNLTTQMAVYREVREDREALAATLRAGGTVNVDGYELAQPMFEQLSAVKLGATADRFGGRCLILQVDRSDSAQPQRELRDLWHRYRHAELRVVQAEPFWKEIETFYDAAPTLFATTREWMEER